MRGILFLASFLAFAVWLEPLHAQEVGTPNLDVGGTVTVTPGGVKQPESVVPQERMPGERVEPVEPAQPPAETTEPTPPPVPAPEMPERTVPRIEAEPRTTQEAVPAGVGAGPIVTPAPVEDEPDVFADIGDGEEEAPVLPRAGVNLAWTSAMGCALIGAGIVMRRIKR